MVTWPNLGTWVWQVPNRAVFGTLWRYMRLVWSRHGYFGLTKARQNTNHGSTKLAWYAAEAYQKGRIGGKYCNDFIVPNSTSFTSIKVPRLQVDGPAQFKMYWFNQWFLTLILTHNAS